MAIDLFCYVSCDRERTDTLRSELIKERTDLFAENFIISAVRDASPMHLEVAAEHGFSAISFFLISLGNKGSTGSIGFVSQALKSKFGPSILILQENEHKL
ncbi:hypothetical protein GIY62_09215 [Burkholderia plantarii]|uniref:hypothetical protein n=1 Tax=Burkholderia plantarii TaxID=41899 RepID=UPI0027296CF6|nr:hypothetical protein [Burkholderia plantarii]WLE60799.1 hypothetical protein GIY62_09215 [Burkholderia plantarii]